MARKYRLNLDLNPEEKALLDETLKIGKFPSSSVATRRALQLLNLAVKNRKEGGKVIFLNSKGEQETLLIL